MIHTSGTTSAPRPVELTYGNFLWSALGSAVALGVDPKERWLCALPLSHVGGLSILVRSAIYATTAVVHERFDTQRALGALLDEDITLVSLVSTTLARLLDAGLRNPPSLRFALTGGGPVPDALVERAHEAGVPVSPTYGLTEACSQVTTNGPPLFCTRVLIDENGEILVAGPTVARSALAADGRLHTGDLGYIDEHGALHVSGRASDTIVSGGENVAPSEVEAVLEIASGGVGGGGGGTRGRAMGGGGGGDRARRAGSGRGGGCPARALRRPAGPVQGAQARGARLHAAPAHALWQASAPGAVGIRMSIVQPEDERGDEFAAMRPR